LPVEADYFKLSSNISLLRTGKEHAPPEQTKAAASAAICACAFAGVAFGDLFRPVNVHHDAIDEGRAERRFIKAEALQAAVTISFARSRRSRAFKIPAWPTKLVLDRWGDRLEKRVRPLQPALVAAEGPRGEPSAER